MTKLGKKTRQLPTRGGLNDLGKTHRTIADYVKVAPSAEASPSIVNNLRKPKGK